MSRPVTGTCETSTGVDSSGPGILVNMCRRPGVEHPFSPFGIILCPEHCAALARSKKYGTTWEEGHCGRE